MERKDLNMILEKHKLWLEGDPRGERADLRGADVRDADLSYADLRNEQLTQIACHLVKTGQHSKNASEETKTELSKLIDYANNFHRVNECGKIENGQEEQK